MAAPGSESVSAHAVASLRFAAARANAPQLLGGLIKEDVRGVGHGFWHDHSSREWGQEASEMWALCPLDLAYFQRHAAQSRPTGGHRA